MRKRFEQSPKLDAVLISEVNLDNKSRHELPQLLSGLQYIFVTPSLNAQIFEILENNILSINNHTGRLGMSLWEILVLGCMRLNLDIDYDFLQDHANNHLAVRGILGVSTKQVFEQDKYYSLQTIKDNVSLLSESCLQQISEVVVKAGHELKKKENAKQQAKEDQPIRLNLKTDSYAVESNIHFPTDISLLWDSSRKCMDTIIAAKQVVELLGWRKINWWNKKVKSAYRQTANIHQKKGKGYHQRLKQSAQKYLQITKELDRRVKQSIDSLKQSTDVLSIVFEQTLSHYQKMLIKHIDLMERRIIKGEKIPHSEKLFSIFEPHAEWIQKGKANNKVELGHNVLVTTDQYHLIVDHKVMVNQSDSSQPIELLQRLEQRFKEIYCIESMSFDRGFFSQLSKQALNKKVKQLVMPSKGKSNTKQIEQEQSKIFRLLTNRHCAVESNINELEHAGVNKVPDKGLEGFKKYVALGVLAYNIRRLGKMVIEVNTASTSQKKQKTKKAA